MKYCEVIATCKQSTNFLYYKINTDMPICEVAENVGINDYPHFCKQFKKYYGFTPTEYRKRFSNKKEGNPAK